MEIFGSFGMPLEAKKQTRRTRSNVGSDGLGRTDTLERRNKALIARYYYWTELKRLRNDFALNTLSQEEFFLSVRSIETILCANDAYFAELLQNKPTAKMLAKEFNSFNWR